MAKGEGRRWPEWASAKVKVELKNEQRNLIAAQPILPGELIMVSNEMVGVDMDPENVLKSAFFNEHRKELTNQLLKKQEANPRTMALTFSQLRYTSQIQEN